jgi:hypothetical protein
MQTLVLFVARFLSRMAFVILLAAIAFFIFFFWSSFLSEGQVPFDADSLTIYLFGNQLSDTQAKELLAAINSNTMSAAVFTLLVTLLLAGALLPFYFANVILNSLKPELWFVAVNTGRFRLLAVFFLLAAVLEVLLSVFVAYWLPLGLEFDLPGSFLWLSLVCFLLSYMNQQGVQLYKEVELTV